MRKKIAVGISGGVDSAVSAALLKRSGDFDVVGVYLHCFPESFQKTLSCTDKEDFKTAQEVAKSLDIPFTFFDFEKEYQEKVIDYFFHEYQAGRTPNPDAVCNREIKFGLFLEKARKDLEADFIATGHYAQVKSNHSYHLLSGKDETKDQSYFLYNLSQEQLGRAVFPIGNYLKKEVRQMAKGFGLPNWARKDSQGICFLGKVSVKKFLEQRIEPKKGEVVDKNGQAIGEHEGIWFHTIGQRHGFKITKNIKERVENHIILPLYVIDKDIENNRLIVGWGKECEKDRFEVEKINWINKPSEQAISCLVRIRHLGQLYPCEIKINNGKTEVILDESAWGIAPGQVAVFYKETEVLGGGIIV
ncbi:tRNA 2-thiouridine(34) synthase MnmA [Candidatus Microgenomates bacterium]|nr:tRNA 2-thiouridine(34) synthase MnmA [Candidatus Microgenomates bacterium]